MFDAHVHSAPCLLPRRTDDREAAVAYADAGFSGCVLKGHFEPTVGRARAAGAGLGVDVYGAIVLNAPVGGLNQAAVETALRLGARVVWLPTLDAAAHEAAGLRQPEGRRCAGYRIDDPAVEAALDEILRLVAEADAVLATGHVGHDELRGLLPAAARAGVRRLVATHPTFTVPGLEAAAARELADLGAVVEITAFQLLHQPDADAVRLATVVREVGTERCLLSSDAGQPESPLPPDALHLLVERLTAEGLDRQALEAAASETPERLVAP